MNRLPKNKSLLCKHKETIKSLKLLKGALQSAYCSECKALVFYKGKIYPIDETPYEYTFKCRRCFKEIKIIRKYWDLWNNENEKDIWLCDYCGAERMIILQIAKINDRIKVIERNKLLPEKIQEIQKNLSFSEYVKEINLYASPELKRSFRELEQRCKGE